MNSCQIRVLFFSKSRDMTGIGQTQINIENSQIKAIELFDILVTKFPR